MKDLHLTWIYGENPFLEYNEPELCPTHWSHNTSISNVTQTHTQLQEKQRLSVFAHHLCLLARWVNTKSRVVVPAKDASSRILCFLSPLCLSPFHGGWVSFYPLSHDCCQGAQPRSHVHPYRQFHLTERVFFNRGNYHSLVWLLE